MAELTIQAIQNTARVLPTKETDTPQPSFFYYAYRSRLLPPKGDRSRDRALLDLYYDDFNWLFRSAVSAIAKQVGSTPYELSGDKDHKILVRYYEDLLSQSQFGDFGSGFYGFICRLVEDFLRYDSGAFVEITGGDTRWNTPLVGRATGVAVLDAMRCRLTGIPEWPVDYWPRSDPSGKRQGLIRFHQTRVARFVDMPDSIEEWHNIGDCALSRAVSIVQQQKTMDQYNIQRLDDLPPAGVLAISNVKDWSSAMQLYEASRRRDEGSVWANVMYVESLEPDKPATLQFTPFASVPEHFDYEKYLDIQVKAAALALNVDPQDIWPLTQNQLGTGTQSKILHSKAAGKMLGTLRMLITRFINFYVLPPALEFKFKFSDPEQDRDTADTEKVLTDTALNLKQLFSPEMAAQYLVNTSERFADVLLDEEGQLRLPSEDKKPDVDPMAILPDMVADEIPPASPAPVKPVDTSITTDSETPLSDAENKPAAQQKDIQATRLDFEADVEDAIAAARTDEVSRRRFGVIMRGHIAKYGRKAYQDGMVSGGVEDDLSSDDLDTIAGLVADQSAYVTGLAETLFSIGITDDQFAQKPAMWFNKSIMPFYLAGVAGADADGLYEWVYGDTEHCPDCLRLNGQKHRMSDWIDSGWLPQTDDLACKGFNCMCTLVKTSGRSRGSY